MLTILRQNREKLRSAVESAVLHQCKEILGDTAKYQIEGLIGITEVDADEVILVKLLPNLKSEECVRTDVNTENPTDTEPTAATTDPDIKRETTENQETMGNVEGQLSDLMNPEDDSHKLTDTLFGEGSYEFNMRQDIGGENLSLSVESFQDSFTDINMSTSESSGSLSDTTKHTEDESDFKGSCDNEQDLKNGYDRSLQTPEPRDHIDLDDVTIKIEKPSEMDTSTPLKFNNNPPRNGIKLQRHKSKVKQFPERYSEQRQRDAERMRMRRRLRQSQMTEEERQRQRERWRDKKRKQRLKRKLTRDVKSESCSELKGAIKTEPNEIGTPDQKLILPVGPFDGDKTTSPSNATASVSDSSNVLSLKKDKPELSSNTSDTSCTVTGLLQSTTSAMVLPSPAKPQDSVGSLLNWHATSNGHSACDPKHLSHNTGSWRCDSVSARLPTSQLSSVNSIGNQMRPAFSSGQLNPQPLFDLTRDDCHIRPQFNVHSALQGSHRPLSHGPPMAAYTSTAGPSYPAFSIPHMSTQSSFNSSGFKPPYIKAEPGLVEQPCCSLPGPSPSMNPYVNYKHFGHNPAIRTWGGQSSAMPNLDMPLIKQEPVTAYNNWL